jgi:hypothetical protein
MQTDLFYRCALKNIVPAKYMPATRNTVSSSEDKRQMKARHRAHVGRLRASTGGRNQTQHRTQHALQAQWFVRQCAPLSPLPASLHQSNA